MKAVSTHMLDMLTPSSKYYWSHVKDKPRWLPADWSIVPSGPTGRLVFLNNFEHTVHDLPPKDSWSELPEQGKSWGGWRIPYGWEPAVDDSGVGDRRTIYFLDHVQQRCKRVLPALEQIPRDVIGGRETRVVSLVRPPRSPDGKKQPFGFHRENADAPELVTAVTAGGPADLGDEGLRVGDRIRKIQGIDFATVTGTGTIHTLTDKEFSRLIKAARHVLVLTVESTGHRGSSVMRSRTPTKGHILKINFENGFSKKVALIGDETAQDVVSRIASQSGFLRHDLYQLRIEVSSGPAPRGSNLRRNSFASSTSHWINPDQVIGEMPEMSQSAPVCWLSIRFTPSTANLSKLREIDERTYDYMYEQTIGWVERGVLPNVIDMECAIRLAAIVAQRKWTQATQVVSKRKLPNLAVIDKDIGLENLFTLEMRDRIKREKQKIKKKMIIFLKRHQHSSDDDLKGLYLDVAAKAKLLGGSKFSLSDKNTGLPLSVYIDSVDGIQKCSMDGIGTHLGSVEQIARVETEDASLSSGRATIKLKMHGHSSEAHVTYAFLGEPEVIADMACVLDKYYGMLVNNSRSVRMSPIKTPTQQQLSSLAVPPYNGIHRVLIVGWNYVNRPHTTNKNNDVGPWVDQKFPVPIPSFMTAERKNVSSNALHWTAAAPGSMVVQSALKALNGEVPDIDAQYLSKDESRRTVEAVYVQPPAAHRSSNFSTYENSSVNTLKYQVPSSQDRTAEVMYAVPGGRNNTIIDVESLSELTIPAPGQFADHVESASAPPHRGHRTPPPIPITDEYLEIGNGALPESPIHGFDDLDSSFSSSNFREKVARSNRPTSRTGSVMSGFDDFDGDGFDMDLEIPPPVIDNNELCSPDIPPPRPAPSQKSSSSIVYGFIEGGMGSAPPPLPPRSSRESNPSRRNTEISNEFDDYEHSLDAIHTGEEELADSIDALSTQLESISAIIQGEMPDQQLSRVDQTVLLREMWKCVKIMVTSMWLLAKSSMDGELIEARQSDAVDACSMLTELLQLTYQLSGSLGKQNQLLFVVKDLSIKFLRVVKAAVQGPNASAQTPSEARDVFEPFLKSATLSMRLMLSHEAMVKG